MSRSRVAFTLLEVLIFSGIISTFFVSAAAITTFLLRSMKANEHRIIATRYAEELLEWVRAEKEKDWSNTSGLGGCYNISPVASTDCSPTVILGESPNKIYNRKAEIINSVTIDSDVVQRTIRVIVEWPEGTSKQSIVLDTVVGIWER